MLSDPPELLDPDPELADDLVLLRGWRMTDVACVEAASREGRIPEGTTAPEAHTEETGRAL